MTDVDATAPSAPEAESQQFLKIGDYRPQDVSTTTNNTTSIVNPTQSNISNNNQNDGHAHPTSAFFTIIFKAVAVVLYCFGSWFSDNFVIVFVLVILALASDFWAVKNVTGRLLVGLRWWNEVKEDGTSEWKFESRSDTRIVNKRDSNLFWSALYVTPVVWFLLALAAVMQFNLKWLPLTVVGLALAGAQLFGYWKCQRDQSKKIKNLVEQVGAGLVQQQIQSTFKGSNV